MSSQFQLLRQRRFLPFFVTQFLGAFNDNVFKTALITLVSFRAGQLTTLDGATLATLLPGLFILPYFLFSATSGQIADKFFTEIESYDAVPNTFFHASFGHLIGYQAGYYGYMWSEVLAQDMLSAFGDNVMNPATGMRYRKTVLEQGGQADPNHLVSGFLGRKPNSLAFFRHIGGQPELARQPAAAVSG